MKKMVIFVLMLLPMSVALPGGNSIFTVAAEGRYEDLQRVFVPIKLTFRDCFKRTPLHLAAMNGHVKTVKELISLGFEVDVCDWKDYTPLHEAVQSGYAECARVLLENGAKIHSKNEYGNTPLHLAALYDHEACVRLLLQRDADYSIKNIAGEKPVDIAKRFGYDGISGIISTHENDKMADMVAAFVLEDNDCLQKKYGGMPHFFGKSVF